MKLHLDFETRSTLDLKTFGADNYSKHPTTEVICAAYCVDDQPVEIWRPENGPLILPVDITKCEVWAHNAAFEIAMWNNCLFKTHGLVNGPLRIEQMYCTMAMANAMGLPGSLESAAAAAGISELKDDRGYRIMLKLCKPRASGEYFTREEYPEDYEALENYCKQDVKVERELSKRLAPLSAQERKVWLLDQTINMRGVRIDIASAEALRVAVENKKDELDLQMQRLTGNAVPSCAAVVRLTDWVNKRGVKTDKIAKADVKELLSSDIPSEVKEALELRQECAKSSTAKLETMINVQSEGRARNLFSYHGATTGRWAGRAIQLQNLPRSQLSHKDTCDVVELIRKPSGRDAVELMYGSVISAASDSLRALIMADKNKQLVCADFSNIEGRGLAWLAGERWKVKFFADYDAGLIKYDNYQAAYAKAFGIPVKEVTKDHRQIGKVMELACGYGGGVGAFQAMAKGYGVIVSDDKADGLKTAWREAHPATVAYWYECENAAVSAIKNKGDTFHSGYGAGVVAWIFKGSFLCCRLPSGRVMYYPYPKIEDVETPWGETKKGITYMAQNSMTKKWERCKTYGGSLVENITQAVCRDILAEAMLRVEAAGYPIIMHVHDEIVAEIPLDSGRHTLGDFEKLMSTVPKWAKGFPIVAKGWSGDRYRK